jgi:Tfp pilus assembly protein PilF
MAKKRLNKKVAIIGFIVLVIIVFAGIVLFLGLSRDPEKYLRDGEEVAVEAALAENPEQEEELYSRAETLFAKARKYTKDDESKVEILFKIVDMFIEAGDWDKVRGYWGEIARIDDENVKAQLGMLKFYSIVAKTGIAQYWETVKDRSDKLLETARNKNLLSENLSDLDYPGVLESPFTVKQFETYLYLLRGIGTIGIANLGTVKDTNSILSQSISDLKKVIELEPDNVDGYFYLSQAHIIKGEILASRGDITGQEGEYSIAEEFLSRAVEKSPDDVQAYLNLYSIQFSRLITNLERTTDEKSRSKIKDEILSLEGKYKALVEKFPSSAKACFRLSFFYYQLDSLHFQPGFVLTGDGFDRAANLDRAIELVEKAIAHDKSKFDYYMHLANWLHLQYSRYRQQTDLLRAIEISENSFDLAEVEETNGPRRWKNVNNKLVLNTMLVNYYIEQIRQKQGVGGDQEAADPELLAKAEQVVHTIEQILGSRDNLSVIKWRGMVELAKDNEESAIKLLYKVYQDFKADGMYQDGYKKAKDPQVPYALAKILKNTQEKGAYIEFLAAAVGAGLYRDRPEVLLEYSEAMLEYGQFAVAHEAAVSYERFFKPDEKSKMLRIRSLLHKNVDEARKEIAAMPQESVIAVRLNLELIKANVREQVSTLQNTRNSRASLLDQDSTELTKEEALIEEKIKSLNLEYARLVERLILLDPEYVELDTAISACSYFISEGQNAEARSLIDRYSSIVPDNTDVLIYRQYLAEPDPQKVSVERGIEIREKVLSNISDADLRAVSLGRFYLQNSQIEKAKAEYTNVFNPETHDQQDIKPEEITDYQKIAIDQLFLIAVEQNDLDQAEVLSKLAWRLNIDQCQGNYFAARLAMIRKNTEEALNNINEALEQRPLFSEGFLLRCRIHSYLGDLDSAIADARKIMSLNPFSSEGSRLLALSMHNRISQPGYNATVSDIQEVKNFLYSAIARNTGQIRSQLLRLYAGYAYRDNPWQAISTLQQIMGTNPGIGVAVELGTMAFKYGQTQTDEAMKKALFGMADDSFKRGMAIEPRDENDKAVMNVLLSRYSQYLRATGQEEKAQELLSQSQDPELIWKHHFSGGNYKEAMAILEKLYQDNPKDSGILKSLWRVAERINDENTRQFVQKYSNELLLVEDNEENRLSQIQSFIKMDLITEAQHKLQSYKEKYPDKRQSDVLQLEAWLDLRQGKPEEALELVNQSLGINPDSVTGLRLKGEIEIILGKYNDAIRDLQEGFSKSGDMETRTKLAHAYYRAQRFDNAIFELTNIIQDPQGPIRARFLLEVIYLKLDMDKELTELYADTLKRYPDEILLAKRNGSGPNWYQRAGWFAMRKQEFDEAANLYRQAWEKSKGTDGGSLDGYLNALLQGKNWSNVLEESRKHIDSRFAAIAYIRMAEAELGLNDRESAVDHSRKAIEKAGTDESLLNMVLRRTYSLLGEKEVLSFCTEILRSDPDSVAANLSMYNLARNKGEYNKAVQYIDKCISAVDPDSDKWSLFSGNKAILMQLAYQKTSDKEYIEKVVSIYESLLAKKPNNTDILNNMAYILVEDNSRLDDALGYAKRAYELDNMNPNIMDTYGYVLYKNGQYKKADEMIQAAIQLYQKDKVDAPWEVYKHLGMIKDKLENNEQALDAYNNALKAGGDAIPQNEKKTIEDAIGRIAK